MTIIDRALIDPLHESSFSDVDMFQVEIVRMTTKNFQFDPLFDQENSAGGEYSAIFKGFFHPLGAPSSNGSPLKVSLVSAAAHAWLYMSPGDDPATKVSSYVICIPFTKHEPILLPVGFQST